LWVIFALLDPDPDSEYGSGSTDPIEYGSNTDPDPGSGSTTLLVPGGNFFGSLVFLCNLVYARYANFTPKMTAKFGNGSD
jgi:hypothetical protein